MNHQTKQNHLKSLQRRSVRSNDKRPIPQNETPVLPQGFRFQQLTSINCSVAIIISGRNTEKYLVEAIKSALNQTVPCEVIYSDDCSTDTSLAIAQSFIKRGLRVISNGIHTGVCETRNRGALASKAPWLIFMDTDDVLPTNYVADMLSDIKPSTPFIYPNTRAFGNFSVLWRNCVWTEYDKWSHNQVSTTTMWNRQAFMAAGMWDGSMPTMWDYDLAIRCSRYGLPVAGKATLDYRIHDDSQSSQLNERYPDSSIPFKVMIRRKNATLGIGSLLSGRLPELFPQWLDRLACSVRYRKCGQTASVASSKPHLYLLLHNEAQQYLSAWTRLAAKYADTFSSIEFSSIDFDMTHSCEEERRIRVSTLLANSCQLIQDQLGTDLVWLVEDDISVPLEACKELFEYVTSGNRPVMGVSARYYNRHPGLKTQLGGWIQDGKHVEPEVAFHPTTDVDFVGTGCLMYWATRLNSPKTWRAISNIEDATAHDWAWSEDVKAKDEQLLVLGSVVCKHHISVEEWV